jgi:hypothetical protein
MTDWTIRKHVHTHAHSSTPFVKPPTIQTGRNSSAETGQAFLMADGRAMASVELGTEQAMVVYKSSNDDE